MTNDLIVPPTTRFAPPFRLFRRAGGSDRRWPVAFGAALAGPLENGDVALFVARAESWIRDLLRCAEVRLLIGAPAGEPFVDPRGAFRAVRLTSASGGDLGRLEARRGPAAPFSAADDRLLHRIGQILSDATAVVTARAEANRARADLEQVLRTMEMGMVTLDAAMRVTSVTDAALGYLGTNRVSVLDQLFWDVWPGGADTDLRSAVADVLRTGRCGTLLARLPEREEPLSLRIDVLRGGVAILIGEAAAEAKLAARLPQSPKLESIGQLMSGVAHDVNNMLTVMISNLEVILDAAANPDRSAPAQGPETTRELAADALRAGENAAQLVSRLVSVARDQPCATNVVDIAALLASREAMLRRILAPKITLRMSCGTALWDAVADSAELESAILNLVLNAKDAMPEGGVLELSAGNAQVDRLYAAFAGLERAGQYVVLTVADTGTGMSPEVMQRSFEPFFTTKRDGHGTGLGLPMVADFARKSGGLATIESEMGAGTVVRLYLPRATKPASDTLATPSAARGHGVVLLVEDNEMVRTHTETMLRGLGYKVVAAADGPGAIARLRSGLRPDLLISDVFLPGGMSGPDVATAAHAIVPGLPVLFTSGYVADALLRDGVLPAEVALLTKPFRRAELAARVRAQMAVVPASDRDFG